MMLDLLYEGPSNTGIFGVDFWIKLKIIMLCNLVPNSQFASVYENTEEQAL